MSFYGEQPKLSELNFQFSGYYPNRTKLLENANNITVGSYVLISYYIAPNTTTNTSDTLLGGPGRFTHGAGSESSGTLTYNVTMNNNYKTNLQADLAEYHNNYHNTVWQRVAGNSTNTFILIAELNSIAPQLDIEYLPSAIATDNNSDEKDRKTYTILQSYGAGSGNRPIENLLQFLGQDTSKSNPYAILTPISSSTTAPKASLIHYTEPKIDLQNSSELGYKINMPTVPYFILNLQKGNKNTENPDSINVAYDFKTDAYVLNMFLGHFEDYMTKADNGFIIIKGSSTPNLETDRKVGFSYYWNHIDEMAALT